MQELMGQDASVVPNYASIRSALGKVPGVKWSSYLELTPAQALICEVEFAQGVVHVGVHPGIIQHNVRPEASQH